MTPVSYTTRDPSAGVDRRSSTDCDRRMTDDDSIDPHAVVDLRDRGARFCIRHLRAADGPTDRGTSDQRARRQAGHARVQHLGRPLLLGARHLRRHLRTARRLPHRSLRPPARPGVEHPDLRLFRVRRRLLDQHHDAPDSPLDHVHRRVRGVRRGGGVAGRALPRSQAARGRHRLHAGVLVGRRHHGDRRLRADRDLRRSRFPRSTAATPRGATR